MSDNGKWVVVIYVEYDETVMDFGTMLLRGVSMGCDGVLRVRCIPTKEHNAALTFTSAYAAAKAAALLSEMELSIEGANSNRAESIQFVSGCLMQEEKGGV